MASIASDSSPPSPGAHATAAFLDDDDHALFLDHHLSSSSFFPPVATTSQEPLPPAAASASASSSATARKPPRKRPRASRRPPTTVVTTDTSNFRAMVQEFTGIPAPPPFAPHLGPAGVLFGAPHHDPTAAGMGTGTRAPLELLMRPSPLKLPAAPPHASPPAAGSFAHSLFASSSNSDPAGSSSEPYGAFAPMLSGAAPRYDGDGGGFDAAAEEERVLGHGGHSLFSSFLHAGDRYHSH